MCNSVAVLWRICLAMSCMVLLIVKPTTSQPPTPSAEQRAAFYLPDREIVSRKLPPRTSQVYAFDVIPAGNVSITVFPCRGIMRWNITYVGARIFTHPRYPSGKRRKKRCCATAAVSSNFNFNIAGLNSGLGISLGGGAITYYKGGSSGGVYYLRLMNYGHTVADYELFATLRPDRSPYMTLPNDPQVKVTAILSRSLSLSWLPVQPEIWVKKPVTYCVVYHPSSTDLDDDVHSSTCARQRTRITTIHAGCTQSTIRTLVNLEPSRQYDIDVYALNLDTNTETAYLAVTASTAAPPVALFSSTERVAVLPPLQSQVITLQMKRGSPVHVSVSPCQGSVQWSVLDRVGRAVQHFRPQNHIPAGFGLQRQSTYPAGLGISLGQFDMSFNRGFFKDGLYRVMVKNVARQPARFQLYASSTQQTPYPTLPSNSQVFVVMTSRTQIQVEWERSPLPGNLTYCVHSYPHKLASQFGLVHSDCGLKEAAEKRVIRKGDCSFSVQRTLTGLEPHTWYDVDVVVKNTFSKKSRAYTSVRAFTSRGSSFLLSSKFTVLTAFFLSFYFWLC